MDSLFIVPLLAVTIRAGTSLLYATLGEIMTERSGILNMGVEGMMIMGAVTAFAAAYHTQNVWVGLAVGMGVGGILAALHCVLAIMLRADQVVSGLALSIFGIGLANYLGQRLGPDGTELTRLTGPQLERIPIPLLSQIPVVGPSIFTQDVLSYGMYILVPLAAYYLYHTWPGLNLRSVGENPQTADAMGINVIQYRFIHTILGGALAGLGGAHLSLGYTPGWTDGLTAGRGWIAIALVIFSNWDPVRALFGAVLFGGVSSTQFHLQAAGATIPAPILNSLPYLLTIGALIFITWRERVSRHIGAPAALGSAYSREEKH